MKLSVEPSGDLAVVEVHADSLEAGNSDVFKEQAVPVVDEYANIVLNLKHVDFVDSSGCGAILWLHKSLAAKGGGVKICQPTAQARSAFQLMRLHKVCDVLETQDEAVAAFQTS